MFASTLFMLSSVEMVPKAGAIIVDTVIRVKPVADITPVTIHLRLLCQFLGFPVSFPWSNVTKSSSVSAVAGAIFSTSTLLFSPGVTMLLAGCVLAEAIFSTSMASVATVMLGAMIAAEVLGALLLLRAA